MAVDTLYGTYTSARLQTTPQKHIRSQNYRGRVRILADTAELAASDIGSTIEFGRIPSSAVIMSQSKLSYDALAASTTLDLGFKDDASISLAGKTAALVSATSTASAGSVSAIKSVNIDKTGLRVWELLGLALDPKKDLTLIATVGGAAATGTVSPEIQFADD